MSTATTPQTADEIAQAAYDATANYPCYDAQDRFKLLIEQVALHLGAIAEVKAEEADNFQAQVIHACRQKAGLC